MHCAYSKFQKNFPSTKIFFEITKMLLNVLFLHFRSSNQLRMNTTGDTTMQDDSDEQQEVIEVQILPQVSFSSNKEYRYLSSMGKIFASIIFF